MTPRQPPRMQDPRTASEIQHGQTFAFAGFGADASTLAYSGQHVLFRILVVCHKIKPYILESAPQMNQTKKK
jgi:hypothetical protein